MKIKLIPQTEKEKERYLQYSNQNYKESLLEAFDMNEEEAEEQAKRALEQTKKTKEGVTHKLLSVIDEAQPSIIGGLWFILNSQTSRAFLYQITIYKEYRGKGYGKLAMTALHNYCKAHGMKEIRLSVFGFNTVARGLYDGIGYEASTHMMRKKL